MKDIDNTQSIASSVVIATKKDGSLQFCIEYIKLDSKSVKDTYPIPQRDVCLDSPGAVRIF